MKQYEVTFIVDPGLSGDEIKATVQTYETMLKDHGGSIVKVEEMGLKQLAYAINRKSSGIYYCIEWTSETGADNAKFELALRRDERIMRFLTVGLDKYGVKYNEDKRNGLIGKVERKKKKEDTRRGGRGKSDNRSSRSSSRKDAPAPKKEAAAPAPAPAPEAPVKAEEE